MLKTDLENEGLISVDPSNKTSLLLTIPRFVFKSYAKDLTLITFKNYNYSFIEYQVQSTLAFYKPYVIVLKI